MMKLKKGYWKYNVIKNLKNEHLLKNYKIMITKEMYLLAKTVVEIYENNQYLPVVDESNYKEYSLLKKGHLVKCVYIDNQCAKYLTLNKKYKVIDIYYKRQLNFYIKDDNGIIKHYCESNSQFEVCV